MTKRAEHIDRLYELLEELKSGTPAPLTLRECNKKPDFHLPKYGVYFFFESGETRKSDDSLRITRIGANGVGDDTETPLWVRLRTHRGNNPDKIPDEVPEGRVSENMKYVGNHRGSVFRQEVGRAILSKEGLMTQYSEWGKGSDAPESTRLYENPLEKQVSEYILDLPFIWVEGDKNSGQDSTQKYLEEHSIALLSNYNSDSVIDPRQNDWLGHHHPQEKIKKSGLWNRDEVDGADNYTSRYNPDFLDVLEEQVEKTKKNYLMGY